MSRVRFVTRARVLSLMTGVGEEVLRDHVMSGLPYQPQLGFI